MEILLAILSVLIVWALLGLLLVALFVIAKTLSGVRTSLEKVAAGVRAIETEVEPLKPGTARLAEALNRTASSLTAAEQRLAAAGRDGDGSARG